MQNEVPVNNCLPLVQYLTVLSLSPGFFLSGVACYSLKFVSLLQRACIVLASQYEDKNSSTTLHAVTPGPCQTVYTQTLCNCLFSRHFISSCKPHFKVSKDLSPARNPSLWWPNICSLYPGSLKLSLACGRWHCDKFHVNGAA